MHSAPTHGQQIPLFRHPWSRHARLTWQQLAQTLPANLSLELTREHGWRIVPLPVETRRALDLLEVHEGDVNPDTTMREARRRRVEAQLLLEQAQDVLRAVQTDNDARMQRRRPVLIDYQEATG